MSILWISTMLQNEYFACSAHCWHGRESASEKYIQPPNQNNPGNRIATASVFGAGGPPIPKSGLSSSFFTRFTWWHVLSAREENNTQIPTWLLSDCHLLPSFYDGRSSESYVSDEVKSIGSKEPNEQMDKITSKLWEARSRLYQSRFLQVNTK